jgi:hypothetical protein
MRRLRLLHLPPPLRPPHLLLLAALTLSCGGAKPKEASPAEGSEGGFETAETRCLAIARASRERQRNEPDKIVAKHILVKFAGAKNAKADIKRSRGDACTRALEARKLLQGGDKVVSHSPMWWRSTAMSLGRLLAKGPLDRSSEVMSRRHSRTRLGSSNRTRSVTSWRRTSAITSSCGRSNRALTSGRD